MISNGKTFCITARVDGFPLRYLAYDDCGVGYFADDIKFVAGMTEEKANETFLSLINDSPEQALKAFEGRMSSGETIGALFVEQIMLNRIYAHYIKFKE